MLASFLLAEPALTAIAFAAVVAAASYARIAGRAARATASVQAGPQRGERGASSAASAPASPPRVAGLWIVLPVSLAALGLGALLAAAKTPGAHGLLLLLGVVAAALLSVETYRRQRVALNSGHAAVCTLARVAAWLAVLLMIGQPRWDWVVVEWEQPLLTVLIDQSRSMSITDRDSPQGQSRAELFAQATADARLWIEQLDTLYETQTLGIGEGATPLDGWRVSPQAPVSAIAAALRQAGQRRSVHGEPPVAALLICDGAENVVNPRVLGEVATELAAQRTALLAVGVGPAAGISPAVVLDPLVVPERVGSRDRLRVPVVAHVTGCEGRELQVAVLWGDESAEERRVSIERMAQRVGTEFELHPPGPGLHRLTARGTLPTEVGGGSFETSVVVDVRDDVIRVLVLAGQPRNEFGFATRALRGEPRFDVTQRLLLADGMGQEAELRAAVSRWLDYDVVVLGDVPAKRLSFAALRDLADAVRRRGVGLLLVGGRDFYHEGYYSRSELQDVSPVSFRLSRPPDDYRPQFQPTAIGRRHPVLRGLDAEAPARDRGVGAADIWRDLPPLAGAARLGEPKPLTAILATDTAGRPLLTALDVGRGRSIAAAWDSTWPWALSSEGGLAVHRKLWRQMVAWLANRRPVAWIVTDRSRYVRAALEGGQQRLQIRAGLSGIEAPGDDAPREGFKASLRLRRVHAGGEPPIGPLVRPPSTMAAERSSTAPAEQSWTIPLERRGDEWWAELPQDLHTQAWLDDGVYELVFVIEQTAVERSSEAVPSGAAGDDERLILSARTGFEVIAIDLEMQQPTANLALLREVAARTESVGGSYCPIEELPEVVRRLAETDRRRRIDRQATYALTGRQPWLLLVLVVSALALEWVVRKRSGMP